MIGIDAGVAAADGLHRVAAVADHAQPRRCGQRGARRVDARRAFGSTALECDASGRRDEDGGVRRGCIDRARALEIVKMPDTGGHASPGNVARIAPAPRAVTPAAANDTIEIPMHGKIAAGTPIEALQGTEGFAVPAALLGPGEHYALEVSGDSMVEEGILDGDFALIRKVDTARDGEIVVALIDDSEATLKTFRHEGSMIRLDPANRHYEAQRYRPDQVQIQGRLAGLIRRY